MGGIELIDNATLDPVLLAHELEQAWIWGQGRNAELEKVQAELLIYKRRHNRLLVAMRPIRRAVGMSRSPAEIGEVAKEAVRAYNRALDYSEEE